MPALLQDLRFGLRLLFKDRTFTVTALLTLAVCIGANTAMFSIVRSVLLRPLPFPGSERVVMLNNSYPNAGAPRIGAGVPDYFDRREAVPALEHLAIFRREGLTFGDAGGAERLISLRGTPSFFDLVGITPEAGRLFREKDDETANLHKAILSHGFATRKFGDPKSAVGKTLQLNGAAFDVIGVVPPAFTFLQRDIDVFVAAAFSPQEKSDDARHSNSWQMVGRLAPGATLAQVQQQVDALNARNDERFPDLRQMLKDTGFHTVAVMLQDDVVRDVKRSLYLLWGGVVFVLLIGAANIANLVIVRSSGRTREMATRHAIGGDLGRLARQLFTETMLLSIAGGLLGVGLGYGTIRFVSALNLNELPRGYEIGVDAASVASMLAVSLIIGAAIGLAPIARLWRLNLNAALREESRGGTSSRGANLVRKGLAMAQVAIALVLLVGAGLLLASFRAVLSLDYGFRPDGVATATVSLPQGSYTNSAASIAFASRALDAIRALPGVTAAGVTTTVPFSGNNNYNVMMAEGYVPKPGESLLAPLQIVASAGYFEAMKIPIVKGRAFDERDVADAAPAVIVDERLARHFWPDRDPIGRHLYNPDGLSDITKVGPATKLWNVVGVAKEVQMTDPRADVTPVGVFYHPFPQLPARGMTFTVRARDASGPILNDVRRAIAAIDPQLPVFRVQPMQQWVDSALVGRRVPMLIAIAFGAVALFLSAVGIYGVLAYSVTERRRELGVRMALGGSGGDVFRLVIGDGLRIVGIGVCAGLAGAMGVVQIMKSQLFNVAPTDPLVFVAVTAVLAAVALVASGIPALRASRIDPMIALGK